MGLHIHTHIFFLPPILCSVLSECTFDMHADICFVVPQHTVSMTTVSQLVSHGVVVAGSVDTWRLELDRLYVWVCRAWHMQPNGAASSLLTAPWCSVLSCTKSFCACALRPKETMCDSEMGVSHTPKLAPYSSADDNAASGQGCTGTLVAARR